MPITMTVNSVKKHDFACLILMLFLSLQCIKSIAMLGIDKKELPKVEGKYAREMREALYRLHRGELNVSE